MRWATGERMWDTALPVSLAVAVVVDVAVAPEGFGTSRAQSLLVLVPMALVLVLRRHRPGLVAVVCAGLVVLYVARVQNDLAAQPPLEPYLALLMAGFALALHAADREFRLAGGVCAVLLLAEEGSALAAGRPVGDVLPAILFWGTAVTVGRLLHRRRAEAQAAQARAAHAEAERDERARRAAVTERTRIARELHDVVAHNLSVIVIQAAAEARTADGSAAETLRMIERIGRETLAELRDLLGLLRTEGDKTALMAPPPSLRQLDALLLQLRGAGLQVDASVVGDPVDLPAGLDLSAYRIVQEALTNVLKHAPGARVQLRLVYGAEGLVVEVVDDGPRRDLPKPRVAGAGQGMVGMRERVALYGGSLTADSSDGRGFVVRAELPLITP